MSQLLHRHQLFFLDGESGVEGGDVTVGGLLDIIEHLFELILGDLTVFLSFFGDLVGIAADVAQSDFGILGLGFGLF